jgi:hypothetical protein
MQANGKDEPRSVALLRITLHYRLNLSGIGSVSAGQTQDASDDQAGWQAQG